MKRNSKIALAIALFCILLAVFAFTWQDSTYQGLDETVNGIANSYAKEVGAGEKKPLFDTEKGDLLLFLFLGAGLVCGFFLGYQWHKWVITDKEGLQKENQ